MFRLPHFIPLQRSAFFMDSGSSTSTFAQCFGTASWNTDVTTTPRSAKNSVSTSSDTALSIFRTTNICLPSGIAAPITTLTPNPSSHCHKVSGFALMSSVCSFRIGRSSTELIRPLVTSSSSQEPSSCSIKVHPSEWTCRTASVLLCFTNCPCSGMVMRMCLRPTVRAATNSCLTLTKRNGLEGWRSDDESSSEMCTRMPFSAGTSNTSSQPRPP
mmetsp:Transcript_64374/g.172332  ORF Transcript_64374/g.172332 Transcript_64374/m.172332 type:complete len:215 (-) Transcript_64374:717-1361(-)